MIKIESYIGTTEISQEYFSALVGRAASDCFGVSGMSCITPVQGLRAKFSVKENPTQGVRVRSIGGKLVVDLHIIVTYGVNISAIVKSIINKVRYTVEEATGLTVSKVNVYVDGLKA